MIHIPIFLGEFGADNTGGYKYSTGDLNTISGNATGFADGGPDNASRVEYHRFIVEQAINKGFSFAAWDSGPKSNKTINKRTDSPITLNYNINDFSVTSYNPKVTTISTVVDNSTLGRRCKGCFIKFRNMALMLRSWPRSYYFQS